MVGIQVFIKLSQIAVAVLGIEHGRFLGDSRVAVDAREHLFDEKAQGVDVGPSVRLGETVLFGGCYADGADELGIFGGAGLKDLGRIIIDNVDVAFLVDQDVVSLQVPVDYGWFGRMQELDAGDDLV